MSVELARMLAYVLVAALSLGTGWQVHAWKVGSDNAEQLVWQAEADKKLRATIAEVAKNTLDAIDDIKITNTTIVQKTRHEITREPMPADCRIPASWMRQINLGRAGGSIPAEGVPANPSD